jgi:hypothetical protein
MTFPTSGALSLTSLILLGCSNPFEQTVCTLEFRHGIVVEIRDAVTGEPRAAQAQGTVRDGAYLESLQPTGIFPDYESSMLFRYGAGERAGTYTVEVRRSGYQTWTAGNVVVDRGRCHVNTRTLRADLVPLAQ